jgi:hypothetical protein
MKESVSCGTGSDEDPLLGSADELLWNSALSFLGSVEESESGEGLGIMVALNNVSAHASPSAKSGNLSASDPASLAPSFHARGEIDSRLVN